MNAHNDKNDTGLAPLDRRHFDDVTLGVMDELAVLIMAARSLRDMRATFDHCKDLEVELDRFEPTASNLLKLMSNASGELISAVMRAVTTRETVIADARSKYGTQIEAMLPEVQLVAKQATEKAQSNLLAARVAQPLKVMVGRWTTAKL